MGLIINMTDEQRKELLRQAERLLNKRKKDRKACLIPVQYNILENLYSSFILDINDSGVFIETDERFPDGLDIMLKYFDPFSRKLSELQGKIVWSSDDGIGVKFQSYLYSPF